MKASLRATVPSEEEALIAFLARAYSADASAPFLDPALIRWKYWTQRGDFSGPRSYVLEKNGQIVAHACLCPLTVRNGGGEMLGVHTIDWCSDPRAPGAGIALMHRISELFEFVLAIGGGDDTRRILPKAGFRQVAGAWVAARPLRPLKQTRFHQHVNWKLPVRLARNAWWAQIPSAHVPAEWSSARRTPEQLQVPDITDTHFTPAPRNSAFLRYIESCPTATIVSYQLLRNNLPEGVFAISVAQKQARLVGAWLDQPSKESLVALYGLVQREAGAFQDACEIVAMGGSETNAAAATESGLRILDRVPVFLLSKHSPLPDLQGEFQFAEFDHFFLSGRTPEFRT